MGYYTILIMNASIVRPPWRMREVITEAFEPLARQAGLDLNLVTEQRPQPDSGDLPDVSLEFDGTRRALGHHFFGGGMLAEQSGSIAIGSMLEMRVGGTVRRERLSEQDPNRPMTRRMLAARTSHMETTRNLFVNGDPGFARAVGNVCVHELGHTIGNLRHNGSPTNYMFTGALIDRVFGPDWRNYENLRRLWSGRMSFNNDQRGILTRAIANRDLLGVSTSP